MLNLVTQCLDLLWYLCKLAHTKFDNAPYAHVNKQLKKTCNNCYVCLDVSNQLSKETFPYRILQGFFFPYSGHIEDTKSVEFASVAVCPRLTPFCHRMAGLLVSPVSPVSPVQFLVFNVARVRVRVPQS